MSEPPGLASPPAWVSVRLEQVSLPGLEPARPVAVWRPGQAWAHLGSEQLQESVLVHPERVSPPERAWGLLVPARFHTVMSALFLTGGPRSTTTAIGVPM